MDPASLKQQALALWDEGYRCHRQGDLHQAIKFYTSSIETWPTAEAYTFRGWAYSYLGRIDDAIADCKKAIETDPTFGNPYNDIGSYLMAKGELDEAIDWFERAKQAPRYEPRHFPYMNLGRLYAAKGMVTRAIEELQGALNIVPDDPGCLQMIARLRALLN